MFFNLWKNWVKISLLKITSNDIRHVSHVKTINNTIDQIQTHPNNSHSDSIIIDTVKRMIKMDKIIVETVKIQNKNIWKYLWNNNWNDNWNIKIKWNDNWNY